jgi:hypothetical protein
MEHSECSAVSFGDFVLSDQQTKPPIWGAGNLRLAIEAAGVALWSWNVDNDKLTMDERGYRLWDVPVSEFVTFEDCPRTSIRQTAIV